MRGREDPRLDLAVALGPALLAAVLGLISVSSRSIGFDEAATIAIATQHGGALGSAIAHDGGNMSGYYLFAHVLFALFGTSEFLIRLPSVLSNAATAGLTALIAIRLFDRRVAFIAGVLVAVSLPLVFWGQDARGYAPMVAFATASFLAYVHLVEDERPGRGALAAYFVTTTVAAYCGFIVVLVIPAQLLMLYWRPGAIRAVAAALGACVVCWIPLVVLAVRRGSGQLFWVPHLSLTVEKQMLEALTSAGLQPSFHPTATMWALIAVTVLLVAAVVVVHVGRASRPARGHRTELWGQALAILWLFVPVVLAFAESLVAQPIFIPRNVLMCLPAVALLLAIGLADRRLPAVVSLGAVVAVLALRALALAPSYGVSPEDWNTATAYVLARAEPGDCAAFYPLDARMPFAYYVGRRGASATAPRAVFPDLRWDVVKPYVEDYSTPSASQIASIRASCPRLWLISSHEGQPRGASAESRQNWDRFLALRAALERDYGAHHRVQFSYAATIHADLLTKAAASRRRRSGR